MIKQVSLSNWENSYFGGYRKIIYDFPEVKVPAEIEWDTDKLTTDLSWYARNKLTKILLCKGVEHGQTYVLFTLPPTKEIITDPFTGKKQCVYKINKKSQKEYIDSVIYLEDELGNLFSNYQDQLNLLDIYYIPENIGKGSGEEGQKGQSGEIEGEEDAKKKSEAQKKKEDAERRLIISQFSNALKGIKALKREYNNEDRIGGDLTKRTKFVVIKPECKSIIYLEDEIKHANALVKSLDINLDPTHDRVNNLRSGKLDTSRLATVMTGNPNLYYRIEENQTTRPFSVCILGDESGSMCGSNIVYQKKTVKILYKAFSQIIPENRIYVYGHSGPSTPEIYIYNDPYNLNFEKSINSMTSRSQNYDGPVIESVYNKIRSQTNDNILFISISDGAPGGSHYGGPHAITELKRIIEKCKRDGFVTMGVGFGYSGVQEIYNYNAIIHSYDKDLVKKVSSLVNIVVKTEFQDR